MLNERLYRELQNLERKIQLVINENKRLKEDLHRIKGEKDHLKAEIDSQKIYLNSFQNQMETSKLVDNMVVGEGGTTVLKDKINGYIKEIDKCIAHLTE